MSTIRTPDQRVRVFISSTIKELADERTAAREAISQLHLIPVFFEMGARPHPPRDLYRAYLEQSHVFVGIYWNSYGWVAPGMDISGLEDEYRLSFGKPRLIYLKRTTDEREPRLKQLLADIEKSDTACYQQFSTPEELATLLANDLSLLLSEHFQSTWDDTEEPEHIKHATLPILHGQLIGRTEEMQAVKALLLRPDVALVTLTGSGGTGKTSLSIHVAHEVQSQFQDGVYFVALAAETQPDSLIPSIARQIGLYESGKLPLKESLLNFLQRRQVLLVLDNFEQIVSAAPQLSELLNHCPQLKIFVTSRTPLYIRSEHVYTLNPLPVPDLAALQHPEEISLVPSVELFMLRAKEVNPFLNIDEANLECIAKICRKLDGLPLAIELAAARTKLLPPASLLQRMEKMLDTLTRGAQDLPDRHKTLRATIDWSHNLLDENCKAIFRRLAVFNGGCTLDAADDIVNWESVDILQVMERLVDLGLVKTTHTNEDPVFSMFETVRAYAIELFEKSGEKEKLRQMHATYYICLVEEAEPYSWAPQRNLWSARMDKDYQNIRDAFYYTLEQGDYDNAWKIVGCLGYFWISLGKMSEALKRIEEAKISADPAIHGQIIAKVNPKNQAPALRISGLVHFFKSTFKKAIEDMKMSMDISEALGDEVGKARTLGYYGVAAVSVGDFSASTCFQEAMELGKRHNDSYSMVIASTFQSEVLMFMNQWEAAKELVLTGLELGIRDDDKLLIAMSYLQYGNIEIVAGNYEKAQTPYRMSFELSRIVPLGTVKAWGHIGYAFCKLKLGELKEAKEHFTISIHDSWEIGNIATVIAALIGFAGVAIVEGNPLKAARLFGAAEALSQKWGYTIWNATRKMQEFILQNLEKDPRQELINAEKKAGAAMTIEKARGYALQENK